MEAGGSVAEGVATEPARFSILTDLVASWLRRRSVCSDCNGWGKRFDRNEASNQHPKLALLRFCNLAFRKNNMPVTIRTTWFNFRNSHEERFKHTSPIAH